MDPDCRGMENNPASFTDSEKTVSDSERTVSDNTAYEVNIGSSDLEHERSLIIRKFASVSKSSVNTKPGSMAAVIRNGAAELSPDGNIIGMNIIYSSINSYIVLVFLPGMGNSPASRVKFNVAPRGLVKISGEISVISDQINFNNLGDAAQMPIMKFYPGPFTVTFFLPGHVLPRSCKVTSYNNGFLEIQIMKPGHRVRREESHLHLLQAGIQ